MNKRGHKGVNRHKRGGYSKHAKHGNAESGGGGFGIVLFFIFIIIITVL